MLNKLNAWREHTKKRRILRNIRESMLFFGYDTSRLSDEELEHRIIRSSLKLAKAARKLGITAAEAATIFNGAAKILQRPPPGPLDFSDR